LFLQRFIADDLQHGLVIFIHQNGHTPPGFLAGTLDDTGKSFSRMSTAL
jgi:hypothetical protein